VTKIRQLFPARISTTLSDGARRGLWITLLTAASVASSLIFACATPFAAFATLAAINMKRADALMLAIVVWLANQFVGYGILHYPQTPDSFAWGAAIGIAALLATWIAASIGKHLLSIAPFLSAVVAFMGAFAAYELALYAASFVLPSSDGAFSWPIVADILKVNVLALIGLMILSAIGALVGLMRTASMTAARH
jgi:hypothetical protein